MKDSNAVVHPSHYNAGGIECIDAIRAALTPEEFRGFCKGNALKYVWRCEHKGKPAEDLEKANAYTAYCIDSYKTAAPAASSVTSVYHCGDVVPREMLEKVAEAVRNSCWREYESGVVSLNFYEVDLGTIVRGVLAEK